MFYALQRLLEQERNHIFMASYFENTVAEILRVVFKDEWNSRYQARFGSWDDTSGIGSLLFNLEKNGSRTIQIGYLEKFRLGDTNKWDCPVLFDAILSSHVIGKSNLDPSIMINVQKLQSTLNRITHSDAATAALSNHDFQAMLTDVNNSLYALRQPSNYTTQIEIQRNQYKSFQVFPTRPHEDVVYRSWKIHAKLLELDTLRINSGGKLTYYYISGNPGSGKTQLSQRLCKDLFNDVNWQRETAFVMTLNAENTDTLLHSYQDFCQRLNCNDNILVSIMNSYKLKEIKIKLLKSLITTRIKTWKKWWIIVDNVVFLDTIYPLLPQMGDEDWNNGQIILTVRNEMAGMIPADGTFTKHISIGDGTEFRPFSALLSLERLLFLPRWPFYYWK